MNNPYAAAGQPPSVDLRETVVYLVEREREIVAYFKDVMEQREKSFRERESVLLQEIQRLCQITTEPPPAPVPPPPPARAKRARKSKATVGPRNDSDGGAPD